MGNGKKGVGSQVLGPDKSHLDNIKFIVPRGNSSERTQTIAETGTMRWDIPWGYINPTQQERFKTICDARQQAVAERENGTVLSKQKIKIRAKTDGSCEAISSGGR